VNSSFIDLLNAHLKRLGWSEDVLVRKARINQRTLYRWRHGSNAPKPGTAGRIADALELDEGQRAELLSACKVANQTANERLARLENRLSQMERRLNQLARTQTATARR
jgi:transcriptional regulator with XRE-family HTH domain